jgi:DNA-binding NtrC family response regulator
MNEKLTVFIVDDDHQSMKQISRDLQREGIYSLAVFTNSADLINNLQSLPDVIILDYALRDENGLDLMKKIKSFDPNIYIIFFSAQKNIEIAVKAIKYGAFDYLEKTKYSFRKLKKTLSSISDKIGEELSQGDDYMLKKLMRH